MPGRRRTQPARGDPIEEAPAPIGAGIEVLRAAAAGCRACDLWTLGTQTVFGEGPPRARMVLVGEQPGDVEDIEGRPFVGPAGAVLERALDEAGIERAQVYLTNAVKHFKWEPRGTRRIHKKPNAREVRACHPWIEGELAAVRPQVLVCLGATAAKALLGPAVSVTRQRGQPVPSALAPVVTVTVHPSSILRQPDSDARRMAMATFVEDLRRAATHLHAPSRDTT